MNTEARLLEALQVGGPRASLPSASAAAKVLLGTLARSEALEYYLHSNAERDVLRRILMILEDAVSDSKSSVSEKPIISLDRALTAYTRALYSSRSDLGVASAEKVRKIEVPLS